MHVLLDRILIAGPQVKCCYHTHFPHEEQTRRAQWRARDSTASEQESASLSVAPPRGVRRGQQTFYVKPLFQNGDCQEGYKNRDVQHPSQLTV